MGMFMDADGIPLAFSVFDGNRNKVVEDMKQYIMQLYEIYDLY